MCPELRGKHSSIDPEARIEEAKGLAAAIGLVVADAFADPQIVARGMQIAMHGTDGTPIPGVRTPIRFAGLDLATDSASPRKGQHSA